MSSAELLLVEDDLLLARALERNLVARGIAVRHVARCSSALAAVGPFPVGVFDIELPDGDGIELARLLQSNGMVGRVVFYTACAEPARLSRARELGTVFPKSVNLPSLLEPSLLEGVAHRGGREALQTSLS